MPNDLHEKLTELTEAEIKKWEGQEHSDIVGGSTSGRVINCTGSVKLNMEMPKGAENEYTRKGTALHSCMQLLLEDALDSVDDLEGWTHPNGYTITKDDIIDKIEPALTWFDNVLNPDDFWVEPRVELVSVMEGAFGSADVVWVKSVSERLLDSVLRKELLPEFLFMHADNYPETDEQVIIGGVADWKFGDGVPVEADNNSQLKFYLRGADEAAFISECEVFVGIIFQPSGKVTPDEYEKYGIYYDDDLEDFAAELKAAVHKAMGDDASFKAGDHCKWCPANTNKACEEINKAAIAGPAIDIRNAPTPEKIGEWLELAEIMRAWLGDLDKLAVEYAEKGFPPPGKKLKERHGHYKFIDEKKAHGMMQRAGITAADRYTKKIISKTQAEKLLRKTDGGIPKNWEGNIERPFLGYTLVDDDGKPGAVSAGAAVKQLSETLRIANVKAK